jgi:DNA-binding transcriptional ArsR family regulator
MTITVEMTVADLARANGMSERSIYRRLALLRDAGMLRPGLARGIARPVG